MTQVAFDLYDFNNDNRISENDLFRIFRFFEVSSPDEAPPTR
jgi:Ca2+-binding EF-hand superfamily protein